MPANGEANALGTAWFREIQYGKLEARPPIPGVSNTKEFVFKRNRVNLYGKDLNSFPYENAPADCRLEIFRKEPAYAQTMPLLTNQELGDSIQVAVWIEREEVYGAFQTLPLTKITRGYQVDLSKTGAWRKLAVVFVGQEEVTLDDLVISRPEMAEENWKAWWIWFTRDRVESITVFLRKSIHLDAAPVRAMLQYRYDDGGEAYINGKKAGTDVTSLFQAGENVISCYVTQGRYAAGFLAEIDLEFADGSAQKIVTDKTWRFFPSDAEIRAQSQGGPLVNPPEGWKLPGFDDGSWRTCVELFRPPMGDWGPITYQPYAKRIPMNILNDPRPETIQAGQQYTRTLSVSSKVPCELPTPVTMCLLRDGVAFQSWEAGIIPQGASEATMSFSFALTQFIQPGEYQLKLVIPNYDAVDAEGKDINVCNVTIVNDRKAETLDARVKRNEFGVPTLTIDGNPYTSIFSARLKTDHEQHAAMFAKTSLHLYHVYLIPNWPRPDTPSYLQMDALAESFLQGDPEAKMVVKIELRDGTPRWFLQLHPEEGAELDSGRKNGHVSLASMRWRALVDDFLRGLIKHVAESPYADHIIGYMVCEGEEGQWMHYWGGDNPQDAGVMTDYSKPMQDYFRNWLAREYGTDEALQKAWNDSNVTLATAQIPTREERIAAKMSLRLLPRDRRAADFGWALADVVSEGIDHYAKVIKEASGGKALTGALYGHLMDLGGTFLGEQTGYARQRLAVNTPYVDYYLGPISYSHRFRDVGYPGGYDMPSPGTLELHDKIWINENDLRTHLQFPAEYAYSVRTPRDTTMILAREFARALCLRSGYYLYALGESGLNWYDDAETLKTIAELRELGEETITANRGSVSQIATFFDDEAQCRLAQIGCGADVGILVVGQLSSPANPTANMIWVKTETAVSGWKVSSKQPTQ
ncbi:MAG: alpha-L-rhamnosidase N-terminal domain-containing protein, partial [Lentisphaeria bacterium]|nr:alpha-L-rhamnosidase N-terminal domain-containing protein [Lentisphaeria bacterium]